MPQDSAFLGFHNEIRDSLNGDHINITKFESEVDSRYIQVIGDLKGLIKLAYGSCVINSYSNTGRMKVPSFRLKITNA